MPAAERKAVIDKLVRYTGLEARYIDESNLRLDVAHFTRELLRDKHLTIGRYDGRLTGALRTEYRRDQRIRPFQHAHHAAVHGRASPTTCASELGYKTDMYYYPSGGIQPWDYGVQNGFGDTTAMLRNAMHEESRT